MRNIYLLSLIILSVFVTILFCGCFGFDNNIDKEKEIYYNLTMRLKKISQTEMALLNTNIENGTKIGGRTACHGFEGLHDDEESWHRAFRDAK